MVQSQRYDDRVDLDVELSFYQTLALLGRSVFLLSQVKLLFFWKLIFSSVAILPPLAVPWLLKIVVDQVILQAPIEGTVARWPPFMIPLIRYVEGLSPIDVMASVTAVYLFMLIFFGMRAAGQIADLPRGYDAATQSEQALSYGESSTGGLWGLMEVLLSVKLTQKLANGLRTELMGRLTRLNMTTLDEQRIGDSVYRVMYDAPMLPEICFKLAISPVMILIGAVLSVLMIGYSYGEVLPEIVWIASALLPVTLVMTLPLSALARRLNQISRAAGATTTNAMEQSIDNIAAVQALNVAQSESKAFEEKSAESFRRHRFAAVIDLAVYAISYTSIFIGVGFAFYIMTERVVEGTVSPGDYAVLLALFFTLGFAARDLGLYWIELQKNVSAIRRVFFFIDFTSEADRGGDSLRSLNKDIVLESVNFSYSEDVPVLKDINLKFGLNEVVAIVGPTGAGKSTLAYVLPGYIRPNTGTIKFDNQDVSNVPVNQIREKVTYVFQEHMLFSESIRSNLLLAKPDATEEDLLSACKMAGATDFLEDLPQGLDTNVGKSGDTLSVGQKQRLSIARGILRDTPVLILDEPTAALDPKTENMLVSGLRQFARNRLVIVIAHRLSTIKEADRIIFLDDGKVLDIGDHDTLMKNEQGQYRRFVELQMN